ncbi:uncharacterized protein FYW49_011633 [Xenentodon cancila]
MLHSSGRLKLNSSAYKDFIRCSMGLRRLLLLLVLLMFAYNSQGVPEKVEQSLMVNTSADAFPDGNLMKSKSQTSIHGQQKTPCNCKGAGRKKLNKHCQCQESTVHCGGKMKPLCRGRNRKNQPGSKLKNRSLQPSVPI